MRRSHGRPTSIGPGSIPDDPLPTARGRGAQGLERERVTDITRITTAPGLVSRRPSVTLRRQGRRSRPGHRRPIRRVSASRGHEHVLHRPGPELHAPAQSALPAVRGRSRAPSLLPLGHPPRPRRSSALPRRRHLRRPLSHDPHLEGPDRGPADGPSPRVAARHALLGRHLPPQAALHPGDGRRRQVNADRLLPPLLLPDQGESPGRFRQEARPALRRPHDPRQHRLLSPLLPVPPVGDADQVPGARLRPR